jgi:hypothetical protein
MGAKNTMQNFFMGMAGQMTSGYGAKTVSTPMGPFKWDDNINMWVNTNNGMVMSNISFQDQFAMIDYGTSDGSGLQGPLAPSLSVSILPTSWGNYYDAIGTFGTADSWVGSAGPVGKPAATAVAFTISGAASITVSLSATVEFGNIQNILYSINNGVTVNYSTPFTISNGNTLKLGLKPNNADGASSIIVTNTTNGSIIEEVFGTFTL